MGLAKHERVLRTSQALAYATTHVGGRKNNEDHYRVAPDIGLFAVADGMGGYEGGEVASRVAIDTVHSFFRRVEGELGLCQPLEDGRSLAEERTLMAFRLAHREVLRRRKGELSDMGTTLSLLLVEGPLAIIAHVGDSRIYRMRKGVLRRLTSDHTVVAAMEAAGVAFCPQTSPYAHMITRAIGFEDDAEPDVSVVDVEPEDLFVLCTDGLTDAVDPVAMARILKETPPTAAGTALVDAALEAGPQDNVTVVVVDVS